MIVSPKHTLENKLCLGIMHLPFKANVILLNSCFLKICSGLPFQSLLVSADRQASTRLDIVFNQSETRALVFKLWKGIFRKQGDTGSKGTSHIWVPGTRLTESGLGSVSGPEVWGSASCNAQISEREAGVPTSKHKQRKPRLGRGSTCPFSLHPWKNLFQILGSVMRENNEEMALTRHVHCINILIFLFCVFFLTKPQFYYL